MGRRRLEIRPIEDKNARQVTFSKRRKGLFKKAKMLSILCGADVGAIIISCRGKLHQFSTSNSLPRTLRRYYNYAESESGTSDGPPSEEQLSKDSEYITKEELLRIIHRGIDEPNSHSVTDLAVLEKQLEVALIQIREAKVIVL
ncbi:hypothetical protein M569_16942, partial [Genlisea aurea]